MRKSKAEENRQTRSSFGRGLGLWGKPMVGQVTRRCWSSRGKVVPQKTSEKGGGGVGGCGGGGGLFFLGGGGCGGGGWVGGGWVGGGWFWGVGGGFR